MSDQEHIEEFDPSEVANLLNRGLKKDELDLSLFEDENFSMGDQQRDEPQFGEVARDEPQRKPVIGGANSVFENQMEKPVVTRAEGQGDPEEEPENDPEYDLEGLSFFEKIKTKIQLARTPVEEENLEDAGTDLSPPGGLLGRFKKTEPEEIPVYQPGTPGDSAFAQNLQTLSSSEISLLQAEIAADETIFTQISKARASAHARQQIGFFMALALVVGFYLVVGWSYITTTLPDAVQPEWTPDFMVGDPMGATLFVLGLLLPLATLFIVTEATRYLISGIVNIKIESILVGVAGFFLSLSSLFSLMDGRITTAAVLLIIYGIIGWIAKVMKI